MGDYFENKEWYDQDSSLIYDHDPLTSKDSLRFSPNHNLVKSRSVSDRSIAQKRHLFCTNIIRNIFSFMELAMIMFIFVIRLSGSND